jgi:uncharacterized repeat protein (TIGR03837 family)
MRACSRTDFPRTLSIFCKVVDNFGDIGICWRLARQWQHEYGLAVTLWVDDLHSFRRICPDVRLDTERQEIAGVAIRHWRSAERSTENTQEATFTADEISDIVIEFFACDIPPACIAAMAQCKPQPVWLNLEGLTAEEWVEGCHTLPSSHPRLPLTKHFFFPGFTDKTGGLPCEASLPMQRQKFQSDAASRADFLRALGLTAAEIAALKISLFCYDHAPVAQLFEVWRQSETAITCLVPEGVAAQAVQDFFAGAASIKTQAGAVAAAAGTAATQGALTVRVLPFVAQPDYDRLLWACDFNFVRGEDSFVRAQWANKPFVWHIYPQDENLHHKKLRAFLQRYLQCDAEPGNALAAFSLCWNNALAVNHSDEGFADWAELWSQLQATMPDMSEHAVRWQQKMLKNGDLAGNLLRFAEGLHSEMLKKSV